MEVCWPTRRTSSSLRLSGSQAPSVNALLCQLSGLHPSHWRTSQFLVFAMCQGVLLPMHTCAWPLASLALPPSGVVTPSLMPGVCFPDLALVSASSPRTRGLATGSPIPSSGWFNRSGLLSSAHWMSSPLRRAALPTLARALLSSLASK